MYAKCGHVYPDSYFVFNGISEKDVISWNALIAGYAENLFAHNAFKLFCWMVESSMQPNYATIANIVPVCASLEVNFAHHFGKAIHCYVLQRRELVSDISVINALVSFYLRSGQVREAECLFYGMEFKDLVSWNSIIAGYASTGKWLKALEVFYNFLSMGTVGPDSVTLLSILPVASHLKKLYLGKQIHGLVLRRAGLREDTAICNAFISFYSKCGEISASYRTFLLISSKDLISWNTMLDAFADAQLGTDFIELSQWMIEEGMVPDSITLRTILQYFASMFRVDKIKEAHCCSIKSGLVMGDDDSTLANLILDAYAKCGRLQYAIRIFENLSGRKNVIACNTVRLASVNSGFHDDASMLFHTMCKRDITTWNLMIRGYAENGRPCEALDLFHEFQNYHMKPDMMTIMGLLPICAQLASVHMLRQCHSYVTRAGFDDICLTGAFIDVYSKCGNITYAHSLFQSALHKDLVIFTAMVNGYAMHGLGKEALGVFNYMLDLGVTPDRVVLTTVLAACSHAGLVDEGLRIFQSMDKLHGVKPTMEHYACVVDLLARGGQIKDAYSFVVGLPVEANASIWGTLLGACRNYHEVELGRAIADHLFDIEAHNIGNYVVMSNLYAANNRWDGVLEMRQMLRTGELTKSAACSWIEVEMKKNIFVAGDTSHPERSIIYKTLRTLNQQSKSSFSFELANL